MHLLPDFFHLRFVRLALFDFTDSFFYDFVGVGQNLLRLLFGLTDQLMPFFLQALIDSLLPGNQFGQFVVHGRAHFPLVLQRDFFQLQLLQQGFVVNLCRAYFLDCRLQNVGGEADLFGDVKCE